MTKNKVGRPKKILSTAIDILGQQEKPYIVKRGRGRPRKYPNPLTKDFDSQPQKLGQIPDLVKSMVVPGMPSVWGRAQKGKRVNVRREGRGGGEYRKENSGDLGFPSAEEFDSSSPAESNSNSNSKSDDSWFSGIVIPGPIPDLDELLRDASVFGNNDFFADLPNDWDFSPID